MDYGINRYHRLLETAAANVEAMLDLDIGGIRG